MYFKLRNLPFTIIFKKTYENIIKSDWTKISGWQFNIWNEITAGVVKYNKDPPKANFENSFDAFPTQAQTASKSSTTDYDAVLSSPLSSPVAKERKRRGSSKTEQKSSRKQ